MAGLQDSLGPGSVLTDPDVTAAYVRRAGIGDLAGVRGLVAR